MNALADLAGHEARSADGHAIVAAAGGIDVVAVEAEVEHQVIGLVRIGRRRRDTDHAAAVLV